MILGFALPVILGLVAVGVDSASISRQKGWLQSTADSVFGDRPDELKAVGESRVESIIDAAGYADRPHNVGVMVDQNEPLSGSTSE